MHAQPLIRVHPRSAATLVELLVGLTIVGVMIGMSLPPLKRGYDRIQTRASANETMSAFFVARSAAIGRGIPTAVAIDAARRGVFVIAGTDTMLAVLVGARHGVSVSATRSSMTYTAAGLGYGGANLSVLLRRGSAADTVLVSREGRVKLGAHAR